MTDVIKLETKHFVKELFLNSCYTGLSFADAMALSEHHFEWNLDGVQRKKNPKWFLAQYSPDSTFCTP